MMEANRTSLHTQHDPWKTYSTTVQNFRRHTSGVFSIHLAMDDLDTRREFQYFPGQFNMLYVPGVGEAAISIAGSTSMGLIQHTIHAVGGVTRAIEKGGVGMSLGLRGPFGTGWPLAPLANSLLQTPTDCSHAWPRSGDIIIVAGGIGLAPLRSMVNYITTHRQEYGTVRVVIGARTSEDLLYRHEYDDWRSNHIDVICTVDRDSPDWKGNIGVVTLLLERLEIANPSRTTLMTCGPEVMMRYAAKSAISRGIQEHQIYVSLERNMNCAIGLCGHCQLGPKFICKEGPVFAYNLVGSLLRIQEL